MNRSATTTAGLSPSPITQSTVPLKAAPGKGAGTIATMEALKKRATMKEMEDEYESGAKKMKNDLEEVEENMEEMKNDLEEVEENLKVVTSRIAKARKTLNAAQAEFVRKTAHSTAELLLGQMAKDGSTKIGPNDPAAPEMQRLTNTTLEQSDVIASSERLKYAPSSSDGKFGFYKKGTKTIQNERGETVNLNVHLVAKAKYDYLTEKNTGLAARHNAMSYNLFDAIVEIADYFPHFLKCGEDYFMIVEEPESWDKDESLVELVGQLFGFKSWNRMHTHLANKDRELGAMSSVRFIEDDIIPYVKCPPCFHKRAGYIFTFKDENTNRFKASGLLSELAMNKPSKEDFLSKHADYTFSVEQIGDNGVREIKRYRTFTDVVKVVGNRFRKEEGGKISEQLKIRHAPSDVGTAKSFETSKGVFIVTRLR